MAIALEIEDKKEADPFYLLEIFNEHDEITDFLHRTIDQGECKEEMNALKNILGANLTALICKYTEYSFAIGFVYGQQFDFYAQREKETAAALKRLLIEEGVLLFGPKGRE